MFTNAKTVMINNKEVQSIITSNGGVIYKNWKLNLTSDKQIIQTGETATLTATLTHGGIGVSGETIYFNYGDVREDTYTPYEGMTPTNYTVYTVVGDGEINFANGMFRLVQGNIHDERVGAGYPMLIRVSNSQLSIKYVANGQEYSVSGNSQIDLTEPFEIWIENTVYSNTFTLANASGVTDSNGVATVSYVGKGTGILNIKAGTIDGIISSEIYSVCDCIFYDDGITNPNSNWDCNLVTRSAELNGTKFLVTTNGATARASMNPLDNSSAYDFDGVPMVFEFDLVDLSISGILQAQFYQTTPTSLNKVFSLKNNSYIGKTIKVVYTGSKMELYVDGVHTGSDVTVTFDTNNKMRVGFTFNIANDYIIVKNVKAYPI